MSVYIPFPLFKMFSNPHTDPDPDPDPDPKPEPRSSCTGKASAPVLVSAPEDDDCLSVTSDVVRDVQGGLGTFEELDEIL